MSKLHRFILILTMLAFIVASGFGHPQDTVAQGASEKVYAVQIAASRVYIDPELFKKNFNIAEELRFFEKNGWYKFIIGSYKTESEALKKMVGLKFESFVTFLDTPPQSLVVPADTSLQIRGDTLKSEINESDLRRLYNLKIREADSAYNIAKNLLLARGLYQEASLIAPDKNYPKDQIVEVEKQLTQKQPLSIFSGLTLKFYLITGLSMTLILMLVIILVIRAKRKMPFTGIDEVDDKNPEPVSIDMIAETADIKRGVISEILQLYPILADEMTEKPEESIKDPVLFQKELERCLNSSREILRMEAECALIRFDLADPFSFLDKLEQEFTYWEQLQVFEMIKRTSVNLPDFSRWLKSPNETVVLFCIRMIHAFKQDFEDEAENRDKNDESASNMVKGIENVFRKQQDDIQSVALQILKSKILK